MVDDLKSLKETLIKSVFSAVAGSSENTDEPGAATGTIRDVISSLASLAGKGKDEMVQIISREIGIAVAGVVKEPLTSILESKKITITVELTPKRKTTKKKSK